MLRDDFKSSQFLSGFKLLDKLLELLLRTSFRLIAELCRQSKLRKASKGGVTYSGSRLKCQK
jgi:hypothetical protein